MSPVIYTKLTGIFLTGAPFGAKNLYEDRCGILLQPVAGYVSSIVISDAKLAYSLKYSRDIDLLDSR